MNAQKMLGAGRISSLTMVRDLHTDTVMSRGSDSLKMPTVAGSTKRKNIRDGRAEVVFALA